MIGTESITCDCLVSSCRHSTELLNAGDSKCVLKCEKPESIDSICSKYDDKKAWCGYYAMWQCVTNSEECTSKPIASPSEQKCNIESLKEKTPDSQLNSFLVCMGG